MVTNNNVNINYIFIDRNSSILNGFGFSVGGDRDVD